MARRKAHVPDYAGTSRGSLLRATREAPESDAPKPGASASFDAPSRYPGVSLLRVLDRPASVVRLTRQFAGAARGHGCVVHARRYRIPPRHHDASRRTPPSGQDARTLAHPKEQSKNNFTSRESSAPPPANRAICDRHHSAGTRSRVAPPQRSGGAASAAPASTQPFGRTTMSD